LGLFADDEGQRSLHLTHWPRIHPSWANEKAEATGEILLEVATAVRRYKSEASISLGAELNRLLLSTCNVELTSLLNAARRDIESVTRAKELSIGENLALNGGHQIFHK